MGVALSVETRSAVTRSRRPRAVADPRRSVGHRGQSSCLATVTLVVLALSWAQCWRTGDLPAREVPRASTDAVSSLAVIDSQEGPVVGAGLALIGDGGRVVVGRASGAFRGDTVRGASDIFVARLGAGGGIEWSTLVGGWGEESATGVAVTPDGSVYVTGLTTSRTVLGARNAGRYALVLTRLSPNGEPAWSRVLSEDKRWYIGEDVAVAADGSVVVVGEVTLIRRGPAGAVPTGSFGLIARFGPSGDLVWKRHVDGQGYEGLKAVVLRGDGRVAVSGYTTSPTLAGVDGPGPTSAVVAAFSWTGRRLWVDLLGAPGIDSRAFAIDAAPDGSLVIAGEGAVRARHRAGLLVAKLGKSGVRRWARVVPGSPYARGFGVAVDTAGLVVASGTAQFGLDGRQIGGSDVLVAAMTPRGRIIARSIAGGDANDHGGVIRASSPGAFELISDSSSRDFETTRIANPPAVMVVGVIVGGQAPCGDERRYQPQIRTAVSLPAPPLRL